MKTHVDNKTYGLLNVSLKTCLNPVRQSWTNATQKLKLFKATLFFRFQSAVTRDTQLNQRCLCFAVSSLSFSTWEAGLDSAALNLSGSLCLHPDRLFSQHWNEIFHRPPQVKPMLCFGFCATSPSKLLLQLFINSVIAPSTRQMTWLSLRWFTQWFFLLDYDWCCLCEVIILILLSHSIYTGTPTRINVFSLDTRFIHWSVKQYFSWSQRRFTQICKHMYYWSAVPRCSRPLSKHYLSGDMSHFFHREQTEVLI